MLAFIAIVYFAVNSTRKAEQNKVWVGLSKETAHQLGTPISSLMAWVELLRSMGTDEDMVREMDKDVNRLSMIASRFSKIGSRPQMEPEELNAVVGRAAGYMQTRISSRINLTTDLTDEPLPVEMSAPLFEWVMENLIKNAVDAMEGSGSITVKTFIDNSRASVTVTDTGKGIPRKNHKTVFNPGFTTKKRGWGLGLALAKRIVEQYHRGKIYVSWSEPSAGTTFRIDLPLVN
jgi:signal transduction histidine kinase